MIQLIIIIVGVLILGSIFLRRYMLVEKGVAAFSLLSKRKGVLDLLHIHKEKGGLELTVEDMIPERSTVDAKKAAKGGMMLKKAEAVLAKGDLKHGEQLLIQSLSLDPSNVEAYHRLGLLYLHQGQFGKAEMMYQKLIMSAQNDPVYLSNLAVALYQQKKLEGAKANYKKAIELDASRPGRFFSLAQVLNELGELEEALGHFKKAIEMDPQNMDYLLTLVQVYTDSGMIDQARSLLAEILAAYPDNEMAKEMLEKSSGGSKPKEESRGKSS